MRPMMMFVIVCFTSTIASAQVPVREWMAYHPGFLGGAAVAVCDLDGDQVPEVVTGAGPGGGPHVRVFTLTGQPRAEWLAHPEAFTGGLHVACAGGLVITSPQGAGGAHVRVWAPFPTQALLGSNGSPVYDGTNCPWVPATACATFPIGVPFPPLPAGPLPIGMLGTDGSPYYSGANCPVLPDGCRSLARGEAFPALVP
jgi:hypothetical protein